MTDQSNNKATPPRRPVGRPRNDGKPHLTRQRVFEVCARLIAEQGYAGASVRTIAKALDASTASLFNLFGSKDNLLNELIVYAATPSLTFYQALDAIDAPADVKLYKSVFEEVVAVAGADQDHAALFYLPELRKPGFELAQQTREQMVAHYRGLVRRGVRQKTLLTDNVKLSAEQIFQLTETSIIGGSTTASIRPRVLAASTADFCLRALLVEPARLPEVQKQASRLTPVIVIPGGG